MVKFIINEKRMKILKVMGIIGKHIFIVLKMIIIKEI